MPEALQNIPWLASAGLEAGCRQEVLRRPLACARLEGRAVGTPAGRALDAMVARPALCVPAESQRAAGPPFARQPLTRALMAAGGLAGPNSRRRMIRTQERTIEKAVPKINHNRTASEIKHGLFSKCFFNRLAPASRPGLSWVRLPQSLQVEAFACWFIVAFALSGRKPQPSTGGRLEPPFVARPVFEDGP